MISKTEESDIPAIVSLLNSSYRGSASQEGWTTEASKIKGAIRTDEAQLKEMMQLPGAVFLKCCDDNGNIEGSVFLHKRDGKLYLGMLGVSPFLQTKGTGKKLMAAAEDHARQENCPAIFMRVFTFRHELISWYEKQGYNKTGELQPFENSKYGYSEEQLEFCIMEKRI